MKLPRDQTVEMTDRGTLQIVPAVAQRMAKLERYLKQDPKGPKAKQYAASLAALKAEQKEGEDDDG